MLSLLKLTIAYQNTPLIDIKKIIDLPEILLVTPEKISVPLTSERSINTVIGICHNDDKDYCEFTAHENIELNTAAGFDPDLHQDRVVFIKEFFDDLIEAGWEISSYPGNAKKFMQQDTAPTPAIKKTLFMRRLSKFLAAHLQKQRSSHISKSIH